MAYIHSVPLKALREMTDFFDRIDPPWVTLEDFQVGLCEDEQVALSGLGVNPNQPHHFIECQTTELARKVYDMLLKKSAVPSPESGQAPKKLFAFYLPKINRTQGISVSAAHRNELYHLRQRSEDEPG